ncbi:MAG: hypothetical protein IJR88_03815 [Clostridia bacterium]|nr:hypothetical protein [Clostridia bacterium]
MKKIRLKFLRAILFFLLALLFAGLAIVEALPKSTTGTYIQQEPFSVSSELLEDGTYKHTVAGYIKNTSSKRQYLDGVIIRFTDQYGEELAVEMAVGNIDPDEIRLVYGFAVSEAPAKKIVGVNTSVLSGDQPILLPEYGLRTESKGFLIFAILSGACFALSVFFFIYRLVRRRRRKRSKKSSS